MRAPVDFHYPRWILAALIAVALGLAWRATDQPMDFRVYHYGANGVFDGTPPSTEKPAVSAGPCTTAILRCFSCSSRRGPSFRLAALARAIG